MKTETSERESDAFASPLAPAEDFEEPADDQDLSKHYAYTPAPRRFDNVVPLRAVPLATASPEFQDTKLAKSSPAIDNVTTGPWPRQAKGRRKTAGASNGRAVCNGHDVRAGKRSAPPRAGRKTPLSIDWRPSDKDRAWAKAQRYTDDAIDRMALKFRAHHVGEGDLAASWSAKWVKWVLGEPLIRGGERQVELDAKTGKPVEDPDEKFYRPRLTWQDNGHFDMRGKWVQDGSPADMTYYVNGKTMPRDWQPPVKDVVRAAASNPQKHQWATGAPETDGWT